MNWLISVFIFALIFFLVRRNLKLTQEKRSVTVFTAFYLFVVAVCFVKMAGLAYFDLGSPISGLVRQLRGLL